MIDTNMRRVAKALRAVAVCVLAPLTGCFSLSRPTPPSEEYVLGAGARPAPVAPGRDAGVAAGTPGSAAAGITVGLRRLDLAPYLATTSIVVRRGSRVGTSGFHRWGEEPGAGIMRAVALSLGSAPTILAVDIAPWPVQMRHDYLVQLHVSHLEGVQAEEGTAATGDVHVRASWEIIRAQDGMLVARGETDRRETGWHVGDYRGLVAGIEKGLTGLAGDVAACLVRLPAATQALDAVAGGTLVVCGVR